MIDAYCSTCGTEREIIALGGNTTGPEAVCKMHERTVVVYDMYFHAKCPLCEALTQARDRSAG